MFDVDAVRQIKHVLLVDDEARYVEVALQPLRIAADGKSVESAKVFFESIVPIYGGSPLPVLFHCYGRTDKLDGSATRR